MIVNKIYEWAQIQPEKTAIFHNGFPLSYALFARSIEASRIYLQGRNLPSDRVALVLARNLVDCWAFVFALRSLGITTICALSPQHAVELGIDNLGCVIMGSNDAKRLQQQDDTLLDVPLIVMPHEIFANIRSGDLPALLPEDTPFGDHIVYTSGTTGVYKKLLMTGVDEERRVQAWIELHPLGREAIHHGAEFRLWTMLGYRYPPGLWYEGATMIFDQRADKFARFFENGPTHTVLVPLMVRELLATKLTARPLPEFELVVAGGFLSQALAEQIVREITSNLTIGYGSTESSRLLDAHFHGNEDLYWLRPVPGRKLEIVDENGEECAIGVEGELRAPLTDLDCSFYINDPEASAAVFHDGCFYPGDIAVKREDGRIRILGRAKDVLNFHGEKIAVSPIEHQFQQWLGVEEVCIFAGLNDEGEEELVVAIEGERAPPREALDKVYSQSRSFDRLRFVIVRKFPRTTLGTAKVNRNELRKIALRKSEQSATTVGPLQASPPANS